MVTSANLSQSRKVLALAALFLSTMCTESDMVITPVVSSLYQVFEGSPTWLINLGITGPAFIGLPFCLLGGWLSDHYDKKRIMVAFFALFTVSSTFGAAIPNVYYFVVMRQFAAGVAWAVTNAAALVIIADMFPGEEEHGRVVGYYGAASSVMGALLSVLAGLLATSGGWTGAFRTYLISIPVLLMLVAFLPSCPPTGLKGGKRDMVKESGAGAWWKRLMPLFVQALLVCTCYLVLIYMPSVYVTDAGIGDESFTGVMAAVVCVTSGLGALFFGTAYKRFKHAVYLPALFVMGLGFVLMAAHPTNGVALGSAAIIGLMWPFYLSYIWVRCTELVPADKWGQATGILSVADGVSSAMSSYVVTGGMALTGASSVLQIWPAFGVILIAVGIASTFWYVLRGRKSDLSAKA